MTAPILVTGGTGTLGSIAVPMLEGSGARVRVLSRTPRASAGGVDHVVGDLATGEGVDEAVRGVRTVLHLAGGPKGDEEATRNLVSAGARAGVEHLVHISVIGADRVPLAWFRSQAGAERAVTESGIPWTILRAAQFHDLTLSAVRAMAKLPVVPAPGGLRFQPVDPREVAERLVELAQGEPAGRVPDLAGPRVYAMDELIRGYLSARGGRRPLVRIRIPGKAGRAYRAGENLSVAGVRNAAVTTGGRSWEEFLAEAVR
ncbi:SDR family oxidoreductase [Streptomonospora wellingtoniae]|uniref:NAD(P)H-binding protein n=1 Tax=Streptomonospora wellingtoniae TaxID=3075544 RepID=A0ABU2KUD2_9ACTN|nr:NAD(P)H-binding protein [Streptomonospora sp. DSM 45055]MDT0302678.1 NAD(P)H-binding protein [Streptomonospora sp. DSM 45055]